MRAPPGLRQQPGQVQGLKPAQRRPGQFLFDADGHHVDTSGVICARVRQQPHFGCAEGHGQVRGQHWSMGLAGVGVNAAGDIAGHHDPQYPGVPPRIQKAAHQLGCRSAKAAVGPRPQDSVNHDVGTRHVCRQLAGVGVGKKMHASAGALKSGHRLGVGLPGGEYRRRTHSPGRQEGGGEEAVSAVVAFAGQDGDTGAVDAPATGLQFVDHGVGETVGGPLHENSAHPGSQERLFGRPDLGSGVGADHGVRSVCRLSRRVSLRPAPWRWRFRRRGLWRRASASRPWPRPPQAPCL